MSNPAVDTKTPTTRTIDYSAQVRRVWGDEWHKRETVYEFSNGRKFESTDQSTSGIYRGS